MGALLIKGDRHAVNSESSGSNSLRADMKKVLTERPRRGGAYSYHDFRSKQNRGDYDNLPSHQGMRRPYGWDTKDFDDLIGPLRGYLRHCVGRRWDDVWSEICQVVASGNTVDQHLRNHVMMEVQTNTVLVDGKVSYLDRYGRGFYEVYGLYVDPVSGILCANDNRRSGKSSPPVIIDGLYYHKGEDGLLYPTSFFRRTKGRYPLKMIGDRKAMLIDGIWYWIGMALTPSPKIVEYVDQEGVVRTRRLVFARYDFVRDENVEEGRYHVSKWQMCSRDLHRYRLCNTR